MAWTKSVDLPGIQALDSIPIRLVPAARPRTGERLRD